jgi:hypothetical protein
MFYYTNYYNNNNNNNNNNSPVDIYETKQQLNYSNLVNVTPNSTQPNNNNNNQSDANASNYFHFYDFNNITSPNSVVGGSQHQQLPHTNQTSNNLLSSSSPVTTIGSANNANFPNTNMVFKNDYYTTLTSAQTTTANNVAFSSPYAYHTNLIRSSHLHALNGGGGIRVGSHHPHPNYNPNNHPPHHHQSSHYHPHNNHHHHHHPHHHRYQSHHAPLPPPPIPPPPPPQPPQPPNANFMIENFYSKINRKNAAAEGKATSTEGVVRKVGNNENDKAKLSTNANAKETTTIKKCKKSNCNSCLNTDQATSTSNSRSLRKKKSLNEPTMEASPAEATTQKATINNDNNNNKLNMVSRKTTGGSSFNKKASNNNNNNKVNHLVETNNYDDLDDDDDEDDEEELLFGGYNFTNTSCKLNKKLQLQQLS